ncbi:MAG: MBL fold metallo-hydrolase [Gemmatimonadota bacterium]|nr:MBL fold metallo-hydrolase [Gemmatimonadota bacterium]
MKFSVLGSGSKGNAVILSHAGVSLLLDAGFGPKVLASRVQQVGLSLSNLIGIAVTHEHGDHSKSATRIAKRVKCPVYGSRGTIEALNGSGNKEIFSQLIPHQPTQIGPFALTPCPTNHDALEPMAFIVEAGGCRIGLAHDLGKPTQALRYAFKNLDALIIEANHDEVLLQTGPYPASVRERIAGVGGHLSNRAAAEFVGDIFHPAFSSFTLVHLSDKCNTPELAKTTVEKHIKPRGFSGQVFVATQEEPLHPIEVGSDPAQLNLTVSA